MNDPDSVNVALGKTAEQSSLSRWSTKLGAGEAVSGRMPPDFSIHTETEDHPWWKIDLGYPYPIATIVVHNRKHPNHAWRSRRLKIEVSRDGDRWLTVHLGVRFFGREAEALRLSLEGRLAARYVRLSLDERQPLHLSQIEIWVRRQHFVLVELWKRFGFPFSLLYRDDDPYQVRFKYYLEGEPPKGDRVGVLSGLRLIRYGRLGNNIIQLRNALQLALLFDIPKIVVFDDPCIAVGPSLVRHGVELAAANDGSREGYFLVGHFYFGFEDFIRNRNYIEAVSTIKSLYDDAFNAPYEADIKRDDELTIHIRAGDIFGPSPHPLYVQPPLAFYTDIISRMMAAGTIARVRIVYEDKGNPCVDALLNHCNVQSIAFRIQHGSLQEDVAALMNSRHLVFGVGTFGYGVCLLSQTVESVHVFQALGDYCAFRDLSSIEHLIVVEPEGGYIVPGEWRASSDQFELMLNYPATQLVYRTIR